MMQPTLHRILVKPDLPEAETASGLVLPQDRDHVPVSGTVVALGPGGSLVRYQARQRAIRDCCEVVESTIRTFGNISPLLLVRDELAGLLGTADHEHELRKGDRVVFPAECGLTVTDDGETYVLLNEDDVVGVSRDEEVAA